MTQSLQPRQPLAIDVLVVGAGSAGVAAAVSAAEEGARTLLVEAAGSVGGTLAGQLLEHSAGFHNREGHQVVADFAQRLVDTSGDAVVAHLAQSSFQPDSADACQPVSLLFKLAGVDFRPLMDYACSHPEEFLPGSVFPDAAEEHINLWGFTTLLQQGHRDGRLDLRRRDRQSGRGTRIAARAGALHPDAARCAARHPFCGQHRLRRVSDGYPLLFAAGAVPYRCRWARFRDCLPQPAATDSRQSAGRRTMLVIGPCGQRVAAHYRHLFRHRRSGGGGGGASGTTGVPAGAASGGRIAGAVSTTWRHYQSG